MPSSPATHTRAQADPSPSAPAPPSPTPLPRPDTLDPDLYLVLAHHVGGDPELHLALTQMVQTLAWCHGRPYPSTALTGTIDETGRATGLDPHFPDEPRGRVVIGKKATYLSRIREHHSW